MIYVLLANGFEETEAITVIDYLRRCDELQVVTIGIGSKMVTSSHGVTILADKLISSIDNENCEMIVLPGGMPGTINLEKSKEVQELIDFCAENNRFIGAICAAPSILGHKGLLKGKKACCYIGFESELLGADISFEPVCVDGKIITSRGAGTANQFAFTLIEALLGEKQKNNIMKSILWQD